MSSRSTVMGSMEMSGWIPTPWIETSPGVRYWAMVSLRAEPSWKSYRTWTDPLPKVSCPTIRARSWALSAPATISLAEALPPFTSTTMG